MSIGSIDDEHWGNATSTTLLHQLRDMWKSPRGIVIRIQALALVAIAFSFFFVCFGSWRRWSNRWIVQKGVLAANVLSLSLGTYSIGLMQSSSVKSEMYPIWAVSMLTLLGCVDSSTAYGLDYPSQLSKMLSQLCLYCGYVMLISMSSISSKIGYIAIGVLSAVTFIKGFHRSLALVLPSKLRNTIRMIAHHMEKEALRMRHGHKDSNMISPRCYRPRDLTGYRYVVYWIPRKETNIFIPAVTIDEIWRCNTGQLRMYVRSWKDVCLSLSLSHLLQRRFFGLKCAESELPMTRDFVFEGLLKGKNDQEEENDHERAFKVIEMELAFLYDVFFTSNAFLYYYESKVASIWACASVVGISFVGVAAVMPGTRLLRTYGGDTIVVGTTMTDLVFTVFILVTLASLQALQLFRCWTSNWARVALVCDYIMSEEEASCWMRWRALMLRKINKWFDRHLWQNQLGQYSLIESVSMRSEWNFFIRALKAGLYQIYSLTSVMLGLQYMEQVFWEMWGVQTGDAVALHADVKAAIIGFVINHEREVKTGSFSFETQSSTSNGIPWIQHCRGRDIVEVILRWHVATCYCELEHKRSHHSDDEENHHGIGSSSGDGNPACSSGVATATTLSKYCAYLVVSAPQLLPGQQVYTKSMHDEVAQATRLVMQGANDRLEAMKTIWSELCRDAGMPKGRQTMEMVLYGLGKDVESSEAWDEALFRLWQSDRKQQGFFTPSSAGEEDVESSVCSIGGITWRKAAELFRKFGGFFTHSSAGEEDVESSVSSIGGITWRKAAELFRKFGGSHDGFRIFWQGLELANQLQSNPNHWKVLEDFWVQALLYAAPSDNVEEHMEHLAKGGEFITHLWALLSHAGILKHEWSETASTAYRGVI